MANTEVVHLQDGLTSVVVSIRGLPAIAHWGKALGALDQSALTALVDAVEPPIPHNSPDVPVPLTVLPAAVAGHSGRPALRGHRSGTHFAPALTVTDYTASDRSLRYTATDPAAELTVNGVLELTPSGLLRVQHTLRNDGDSPYHLDGLEAALPVPARAGELLDFTGRWSRERQPQRRSLDYGTWLRESRRGRTGHDATIGLLAGTPGFGFRTGEVWALHVAWSGNHVTYAERFPDSTPVLGGGELLLPGEVVLARGEEYATPSLYAAYSGNGIDGLSAAFHRKLREGRPAKPRPVVLNTWEAVYFDHDLERLASLADTAAAAGVERFVLDDGWFRHRRADTAGLGDWYVDETVWPDGLNPLIKHVRSLGMEFGLWFEPEMINPDSDLFRAHPDWALGPRPGVLPPSWRNQQVLNLGNPDAFAYILSRLDTLLSEHDIAFVKWDHNRDLIASGTHAQTLAYYRLLDELRERHPNVEIESCSSGGARIDLGVLERTDRVWTSDCNDALERQQIQRWTGVFLPPELMGAHVGPTHSHTTGRTHDLSFRVATAMFGHFGIEWDISSATAEERAGLVAAIEYYKSVRSLVHNGNVVRVDHPDPAAWVHGVVAPDRSEALFCYAQLTTSVGTKPARVLLPGLDPDRTYTVSFDGPAGYPALTQRETPTWESLRLPGSALSEVGLQLPVFNPEQALLIRLS
ncbi:alpha-galactosidase [Lentzea sp. NBRC 105346]|uniref:alpha-galactosidase n=1 Tax=Lentzea sp. NBRC 105346 TaxID=3032205 RepID=UPI0024A46256|nr:alpha-galactosidase [Lentzea sp. NBRC 105346]GLZ36080.1 alpha-galactosidase [Lentzea sp. NBRC 105346]